MRIILLNALEIYIIYTIKTKRHIYLVIKMIKQKKMAVIILNMLTLLMLGRCAGDRLSPASNAPLVNSSVKWIDIAMGGSLCLASPAAGEYRATF